MYIYVHTNTYTDFISLRWTTPGQSFDVILAIYIPQALFQNMHSSMISST